MPQNITPLIAGNWKMNGLKADAMALARGVADGVKQAGWTDREVLVCPPATLVLTIADAPQSEADDQHAHEDEHDDVAGVFSEFAHGNRSRLKGGRDGAHAYHRPPLQATCPDTRHADCTL